jgi:hypothetical protein
VQRGGRKRAWGGEAIGGMRAREGADEGRWAGGHSHEMQGNG